MSDVHCSDVGFGKHYRLPGVEPPRALATTFSTQRYDPLRLPPTLRVSNGATESMFHDVHEMVLAEMPQALLTSLAFPPPRAILSPTFARLDSDVSVNRGRKTWAQKFYDWRDSAGKCVCLARRGVVAHLLASGTAFRNMARCICDAIMQVIEPLVGVVRDVIPGRTSITRVALH